MLLMSLNRKFEWNSLHTIPKTLIQRALTAATIKLNTTQVALSRQLKLLEAALGVTIINRNHKTGSLTPAGIYLAK